MWWWGGSEHFYYTHKHNNQTLEVTGKQIQQIFEYKKSEKEKHYSTPIEMQLPLLQQTHICHAH